MTFLEAQKELCRRLNISFEDINNNPLFSLEDIKAWINLAVKRAWDYARWIFSEEAVYTQTSSEEYYDYPENFVSDSIRILKVEQDDGKMAIYEKITFDDYQKYREEYPDGKDKVFSDYQRFYFINPNTFSGAGKRIEIWGKKRAPKLVNDDDLLPFSPDSKDEENSGNEAIVKLAYSIALGSEKKKDKTRAVIEEKEAYAMLDVIATRELGEQAQYKTKNREFFEIPRFF